VLDPLVGEILRIERGIPSWGNELSTDTLPPEAGLDRTHIDYDRGCYPGQEVISRLKSIGRVNRSLHVVSSSQGSVLLKGMVVESGAGVAGELTSVAGLPASGLHVALAYLNRGAEPPLFALDPLTGAMTPLSIAADNGS
jgi:folate-binding protein YgfZ